MRFPPKSRRLVQIPAFICAAAAATSCNDVTDPNLEPVTSIASPSNEQVFMRGEIVAFEGSSSDPEDGALSGDALTWVSSIDGEIGTGASLTKSDLSLGSHSIVLTAKDADGATGSASVSLTIEAENQAPAVTVTAPDDGVTVTLGNPVTLAGTATDPEDGRMTGSALMWTSSVDGQIGSGNAVTKNDLSAGQHTITLTATDAGGQTGSASINLTINQRPAISITSPADGATFVTTESVTFAGSATDQEDGDLPSDALVWTSSLAGAIGTGASFAKTGLGEGEHVITLTAADAAGAQGTASITIVVTAAAGTPSVTIASPGSGTTITAGATVTFEGSATDPEDGDITGNALVWSSSVDGQIGTGPSVTKNDLSAGPHVVTLTATDAAGETGSTSITLTINQPPTANITSPANAATFTSGDAIAFAGTATDAEDGDLAGNSLVWSNSAGDHLGSGTSITKSDLSNGEHTITLTATDSDGATSTATVSISVVPAEVTVTVTAGSSIGKTDREVEITLTLDLSQIGLPVSGVRGTISWDDDEQDNANKAAYVAGSADGGAWPSSLASQNLVAKGKLQFAAISLSGIADDDIITLTFKVKPSASGDMVFIPNLTQLDVIDAQTGAVTTLQDIGVVFKNISVTVDVQE